MKQNACLAAVLLWIMAMAIGGWFFVNGWTTKGSDGRTEILLAPAERDQILVEMRQLLKGVDGVVRGLGESQLNRQSMEEAARAVGMKMAADTEPAIMAKLPLSFKQLGMSIHKDMDALADAVAQHEAPQQLLKRLASRANGENLVWMGASMCASTFSCRGWFVTNCDSSSTCCRRHDRPGRRRVGCVFLDGRSDASPNCVVSANTYEGHVHMRFRPDRLEHNIMELPHRGYAFGRDFPPT